jgi:hypothetical protein
VRKGDVALFQPGDAAHHDSLTLDDALDALTGSLAHLHRAHEREPLAAGLPHDRARQHVAGDLIQRRREPQQLIAADPGERHNAIDTGDPESQRPRLVQEHRPGGAQPLDRCPSLDDDPYPGCSRKTRDESDRGREYQRAGSRHDEHGERSYGVSAQRPGSRGDADRQRQEERRIAIGHAHERRAALLGLAHEADKRRIGAVGGAASGPQLKRIAGIRRAAGDEMPGRVGGRQGLPGQARLVDHRALADDHAVGRQDLARPDQQHLSDIHILDANLLPAMVGAPPRQARGALDQRGQLATSASRGEGLQRIAPPRASKRSPHPPDTRPAQALRPLPSGRSNPHRDLPPSTFARPSRTAARA